MTRSLRRIGRASMAWTVPDSTSDAIAGAARNAADIASTKLNMNAIRIRTWRDADLDLDLVDAALAARSDTSRSTAPADERDAHHREDEEDPDHAPADDLAQRQRGDHEDRRWPAPSSSRSRGPAQEQVLEAAPARVDGVDPPAEPDDAPPRRRGCGRGRCGRIVEPVVVVGDGAERPRGPRVTASGRGQVGHLDPDGRLAEQLGRACRPRSPGRG